MNNAFINSLKVPFFTVLFIFIFLYVFTRLLGPIPLTVNSIVTTQTDLFTVDGVGEVMAKPDQASFTVGVTQIGATSEAAENEVTTTTNTIIEELKRIGIKEDDIKTQNYSVYPNQNFEGGRNSITGYTANQELQVKAESVEVANRALDVATANGATNISGPNFTLNDEDIEKYRSEARLKAIANAKEKAKELADAAGVRLGRVVSVRESTDGQPPVPMFNRAEMAIDAGGDAANIQPGENTVRSTVSLSYETL